jgi:hypothetical protein
VIGFPGTASAIVAQPIFRPCIVLKDPNTDTRCNATGSGRTVLDMPICDDCFAAVAL